MVDILLSYIFSTNPVIAILDNTGLSVVEYTYDAWGVVVGYICLIELQYLVDDNPFLYRGYIFDKDTGLYYIQGRYYNPKIGRFIQPADISTSNDPNAYRYTNNLTGGSATSRSFVGTAGNPSADLSALVKIPDFSTNPSGVHWKDDFFVADPPKFLDPTEDGFDIVNLGLSIYAGNLYFDNDELSSVFVSIGNVDFSAGFNFPDSKDRNIRLGFDATASLLEVGYDGRVVDVTITLLSAGVSCMLKNGKFKFGCNYGWGGIAVSIDFRELGKTIRGGL